MSVLLFNLVLLVLTSVHGENRELVPSDAPSNLTLLIVREKEVVIEWDPVTPESVRGSFRGYLVRIWNHAGSQAYAFPPDTKTASIDFFPYSKNFITVSARNDKYVGPPSEAVSFDAPAIEPTQPLILNIFPLSNKSVLVQWSKPVKPNGILLGYKIYCSIINDSLSAEETEEVSHHIHDPDKFQAKLTGMVEGVKYRIGLTARNCAGESEKISSDVVLEPHAPAEPFPSKFIYKIGYSIDPNPDESCSSSEEEAPKTTSTTPAGMGRDYDYYDYLVFNETRKGQVKVIEAKTTQSSVDEGNRCLVDCMVLWIPDVRNNPGEYFYLKYRVRGEKEFQVTEPEISEDFIVLNNFDACKNYEIILTAVDGEFSTDSDLLVTPTKIY